MHVDYLESASF